MINSEDQQKMEIGKAIGSALAEMIDEYFAPGTMFTFVVRHPNDKVATLCLTCDNELQKVIPIIQDCIMRQMDV